MTSRSKRQAVIIDIHQYYRTGGTNWKLLQQHVKNGIVDGIIIKTVIGFGINYEKNMYAEHVRLAKKFKIPYVTYHFFDPKAGNIKGQIKLYIDMVGLNQPAYIVDVEKPYKSGRLPTKAEMNTYLEELEAQTGKSPIIYTRKTILDSMRFNREARKYRLWLAQYPYETGTSQYTTVNPFLKRNAWKKPSSVRNSQLSNNVILWQFSEYGNARYYIANRLTKDKDFVFGMNTCDLNVSMEPADEFMREIFGVTGAFDPPDVDDEKDQDIEDIHPGDHENVGGTAPYPNMTNQDMINAFSKAFSRNFWIAVIRAGLDYMGVDSERNKEYVGPAIEDLPDLTKSEKTSVKKRLISAGFLNTNGTEEEKEDKTAPPLDGPGFWVKVKEKKTDCQNFKSGKTGKDLKGKPIMKNVDPPIILKKGNTVRVSSTHWVSDKDKKDGVVFAQRRLEHYYILESPDNPKAVRNYIRKSDTRKIRS